MRNLKFWVSILLLGGLEKIVSLWSLPCRVILAYIGKLESETVFRLARCSAAKTSAEMSGLVNVMMAPEWSGK